LKPNLGSDISLTLEIRYPKTEETQTYNVLLQFDNNVYRSVIVASRLKKIQTSQTSCCVFKFFLGGGSPLHFFGGVPFQFYHSDVDCKILSSNLNLEATGYSETTVSINLQFSKLQKKAMFC